MYGCIHLRACLSAANQLKLCAEAFSPVIEILGSQTAVFDVRGLGKLIGDPHEIAEAIEQKAKEYELDAAVAVAPNRDAAIATARGLGGTRVVAFGEERDLLGPLSLSLLEPDEELQEILDSWGIQTFGELAALPDRGISERLGAQGIRLQRLARGFGVQPILPIVDRPVFTDSMELEHPLELLEPLSFLLSRMLREICSKLQEHGLATNEVRLKLKLDGTEDYQRTLRLPVPGRDAGLLVKLLQYDLNAYPPGAPILGVAVEVEPVEPRRLQNGLFIPQGPEPERLEVTIARIAAVVGEDNIGSPEMLNTHRPGAFRMNRFVMGEEWTAREVKPRLALRYYRPPLEAKVQTRGGRPVSLAAPGIRARVVAYGGPWRSSGDWWTTTSWDRDEWDVACEGGLLYRIFSEGGKWFVEGNYD